VWCLSAGMKIVGDREFDFSELAMLIEVTQFNMIPFPLLG
jgi:hypothetical protein